MMMMVRSVLLLSHIIILTTVLLASLPCGVVGTSNESSELGSTGIRSTTTTMPHSTVIPLTNAIFDMFVTSDPTNGSLWLVKFYAPWCGHCVKLAPVLDDVAPILAGKMSIGKVDCTTEQVLCKKFSVKSYPTLKYFRNGAAHDYPSGRDATSIIAFGEKMSGQPVTLISSYQEAMSKLISKSHPVAYIVFDPNVNDPSSTFVHGLIDASGASQDEKSMMKIIKSTDRTRVYEHVASKLQSHASFGMFHPVDTFPEEIRKLFSFHSDVDGDGPATSSSTYVEGQYFLARIEQGVPLRLYTGDPLSTSHMESFITMHNLPTVLELNGNNFRFVSRRGKPLVIGVYNPDDTTNDKFRTEVTQYAIGGTYKEDYIYSMMDGKRWDKFLAQFQVYGKDGLPQWIVVDVPNWTYWQDSKIDSLSNFVAGVKDGTIKVRRQERPTKVAPWDDFLKTFMDYMPWSLIGVFVVFGGVFYLALCLDQRFIANEYRPLASKSTTTTTTAAASKLKDDDEPSNEDDGSTKKDR